MKQDKVDAAAAADQPRYVNVAGRKVRVPGSPAARLVAGTLLVVGGVLGFLPVLGFWMIPLGLLILSVDLASVRRRRRKMDVWMGRRLNGLRGTSGQSDGATGGTTCGPGAARPEDRT